MQGVRHQWERLFVLVVGHQGGCQYQLVFRVCSVALIGGLGRLQSFVGFLLFEQQARVVALDNGQGWIDGQGHVQSYPGRFILFVEG